MSEPRAYTEDEVRDMIIDHVRAISRYWATLPDTDSSTGRQLSVKDRCEGVAFSILVMLDGNTLTVPAITLKLDPHEEDKKYHLDLGENWFEPGMEISTTLHEFFHKRDET